MTVSECYKYLYDLTNLEYNLHSQEAKDHFNLNNIRFLVNKLIGQNPNLIKDKKLIHIAGTKGKGSTAYLVSSILMSKYNVATFVSPHLITPNERLLFNLNPVSDSEFAQLTSELIGLTDDSPVKPTTFEAFYLMYLMYAYRKNAEVLVVETGLGGRLDATNVIDSDVAVITPIGYDHTDLLGSTIQAIATEKAAIIKGGTAVIAAQYYDINDIFVMQANKVGAEIVFADTEILTETAFDGYGYNVTYNGCRMRLDCIGIHQLSNLQTAIAAVNVLDKNIDYNSVRLQLPPARIQIIGKQPLIILDVAHNRESVDTLVSAIEETFPQMKFNVLSGLASDKDYKYFYKKLSAIAKDITITELSGGKQNNPRVTYDYVKSICNCRLIENFEQAIGFVLSCNEPILITGSFYLAGPVMEYLNLSI